MTDLKYALRQLLKRPGFSAVVIVMLALGIGSTSGIFSLYYELLLRPLPVPAPEQLVNLRAPGPKIGAVSCSGAGNCEYVFSYAMFRDLEAQQDVFATIAALRDVQVNLSYQGQAETGQGMLVSAGYFPALRLRPQLGRLIGPPDEPRIDESPVVVLSDEYWRTRFGADPQVIGRRLTVNGQPLTIVGVAPAGFSGTTIGLRPQVFVPLTLRWLMQPTIPREPENRRAYWLYVFARLEPNVSVDQASAGINRLFMGIVNEIEAPLNSFLSPDALEKFKARRIVLEPAARGQSSVPENVQQPLTLLLGVTVLVLLIVCVNVASLLLARGTSRAGEIAIRASIGATRARLVRVLLVEAGLLAAIGGALGVVVAGATLAFIQWILPPDVTEVASIGLSRAALVFAAAASLATILLFGTVPVFKATRPNLGLVVKGHSTQAVGAREAARFRWILATGQVAFSMVLLVLAGLFARSLLNISRIDLGMKVDSLVTFQVAPRLNGYDKDRVMGLYDRIEEALSAQPGVTSVTSSMVPLLSNSAWGSEVTVEGFERGPGVDANASLNEIGTNFFATLSIPMLAGRHFTEADRLGSPRVGIVNQSFVRKFNLGDAPLGKHFGHHGEEGNGIEIVGIAADAKYSAVKGEVPPQYFLPRRQDADLEGLSYYVRGAGEPETLLRMIPRVVADVAPDLPVDHLRTMTHVLQTNVFLDRLVAILSAAFAVLATVLAAIGLYGVLAYNVAQRTRELGLRLALGATPARLRALVLAQVGFMGLVGGLAGLAGALSAGRAAGAILFGLSGYDPAVLLGAATVLSAVVFAAGYLPAHRASQVAPMEALRQE